MDDDKMPKDPELVAFITEGEKLKKDIVSVISKWPVEADGKFLPQAQLPLSFQQNTQALRIKFRRWLSKVAHQALPLVVHNKDSVERVDHDVQLSLTDLQRAFGDHAPQLKGPEKRQHNVREIQQRLSQSVDNLLEIICSVPDGALASSGLSSAHQPQLSSYRPNTAFILMWMDPTKPKLEDVTNVFKEVFARFGIQALRADDVEHSDRITDLVLDHIKLTVRSF
jgi:hypothetical protein